jgi:hypothetical protein
MSFKMLKLNLFNIMKEKIYEYLQLNLQNKAEISKYSDILNFR